MSNFIQLSRVEGGKRFIIDKNDFITGVEGDEGVGTLVSYYDRTIVANEANNETIIGGVTVVACREPIVYVLEMLNS